MSNLIQIKRSTVNTAPASLSAGELAFSGNTTAESLFIGNPNGGAVVRIGGTKFNYLYQAGAAGTLTANATPIVNSSLWIDAWNTAKLIIGAAGATVNVTSISASANSTQLGGSAGGSNNELVTSWAIKTYVDSHTGATSLTTLTDVNVTGPTTGQLFVYDAGQAKWENRTLSAVTNQTSVTSNDTVTQIGLANDVTIANSLTVTGDLTVQGTLVTFDANNLTVEDSLIKMAKNQAATGTFTDTFDIGFYGVYGNTTNTQYTGLVRDASNSGVYTLFTATANTPEPTTTVDFSNAGFTLATLNSRLVSGGLTVNATAYTLLANSTWSASWTGNSISAGVFSANATSANTTVLNVGPNIFTANATSANTTNFNAGPGVLTANATVGTIGTGTGQITANATVAAVSNVNFGSGQFTSNTTVTLFDGLQSNATVLQLTANSTYAVQITGNTLSLTTALPVTSGGTGNTAAALGDLLVGNGVNSYTRLTVGADGKVLQSNGTTVVYADLDGGAF